MSNHGMDNQVQLKTAELAARLRDLLRDLADKPATGALAQGLEQGLAGLTPEQRREVVAGLIDRVSAGLGNQQSGVPEVPARMLQNALAHGPRDQLDTARVAELAAVMANFAIVLDNLIPGIWKNIAPASAVRKSSTLKVTLARFAAGDKETGRPQVDAEADLLRKLIAGITNGIEFGARDFVQKFIERYGAAEVERSVREEGGGWGIETKCWKKYQQICATTDVEALKREMLGYVAANAEKIVKVGR